MADEIIDGVNECTKHLLDKVDQLDYFDKGVQQKCLELRVWIKKQLNSMPEGERYVGEIEGTPDDWMEKANVRRSLARQFHAVSDMPEDKKGGSVDLEGTGMFEVEGTGTGMEGTGTFEVEESGTIGGEEDFGSDIDSQGQLEIDMSSDP